MMTASTLASEAVRVEISPEEAAVHRAGPGGLSIQCQPLAARGGTDIMWPATVRELSEKKIILTLERRFEPQTALSLSLPESDLSSTSSVFARIVRVERQNDGRWLLECELLHCLEEERLAALARVLQGDQPTSASTDSSDIEINRVTIKGVLFQVRYGACDPIHRPVDRLHVNGRWPLNAGRAMKARIGRGRADETSAEVRVNACYRQNGRWLIDCSFLGAPPAALLEKLRTGVM